MRRVNESVRQVVAEALPDLNDPRIGLVTITGVVTSPDLRVATVYVSVLGNARKKRATMEGLESAHGLLQGRLARQLRMKRTPQLTFEYDLFGRAWRSHDPADRRARPRRRRCR